MDHYHCNNKLKTKKGIIMIRCTSPLFIRARRCSTQVIREKKFPSEQKANSSYENFIGTTATVGCLAGSLFSTSWFLVEMLRENKDTTITGIAAASILTPIVAVIGGWAGAGAGFCFGVSAPVVIPCAIIVGASSLYRTIK